MRLCLPSSCCGGSGIVVSPSCSGCSYGARMRTTAAAARRLLLEHADFALDALDAALIVTDGIDNVFAVAGVEMLDEEGQLLGWDLVANGFEVRVVGLDALFGLFGAPHVLALDAPELALPSDLLEQIQEELPQRLGGEARGVEGLVAADKGIGLQDGGDADKRFGLDAILEDRLEEEEGLEWCEGGGFERCCRRRRRVRCCCRCCCWRRRRDGRGSLGGHAPWEKGPAPRR